MCIEESVVVERQIDDNLRQTVAEIGKIDLFKGLIRELF
jgi:hypothetical protein